jgi:spore maturation protein SpmA
MPAADAANTNKKEIMRNVLHFLALVTASIPGTPCTLAIFFQQYERKRPGLFIGSFIFFKNQVWGAAGRKINFP